jgi:hypothetical protein
VLAVAAASLAAVGTVEGAGETLTRTAARAWHAVFEDRPTAAGERRQRVLVVLSAPSLADRVAAAEEAPPPARQRRWTREAEGAQKLLLAGLRDRGVEVVRNEVFTRTFNGFSALVGARALAELERNPGVAGVYPVRTVYPAAPSAETLGGAACSIPRSSNVPSRRARGPSCRCTSTATRSTCSRCSASAYRWWGTPRRRTAPGWPAATWPPSGR